MRKIFAVMCCMILMCSCGKTPQKNDKLNIVCTVFPEYDWVRQIVGDNSEKFEITYLLSNGSDMHSYQPSVDDMIKISSCDLFIYIGGESDKWAEDAVKQAENKNLKSISLLDSLGDSAKEEEVKEGMQDSEEEHDHQHEEQAEYDEHIWLSLENARTLCNVIAEEIYSLDSENKSDYQNNLTAYCQELENLDTQYSETLSDVPNKTLIFGDRFPFRYLVDDYGLDYYAVFSGCSAETEASFETITFLADKTDEINAKSIFKIEGSDDSMANAIIASTEKKNQKIFCLDSIQSVTSEQIKNNVTYISIMKSNLDVLKEALS